MIDICVLLLIYFIAAATLVPRESDLSLSLPPITSSNPLPSEIEPLRIRIEPDGAIHAGGGEFLMPLDADPALRELPLLGAHLETYAAAARAVGSHPMVRIEPSDTTSQQRLVDVLNCLAAAGITSVVFPDFP
jgi:biopolymer transport protein ExbD